jgi:hypothetical protein
MNPKQFNGMLQEYRCLMQTISSLKRYGCWIKSQLVNRHKKYGNDEEIVINWERIKYWIFLTYYIGSDLALEQIPPSMK